MIFAIFLLKSVTCTVGKSSNILGEGVLTSTHNLYFGQKYGKLYTLALLYKCVI